MHEAIAKEVARKAGSRKCCRRVGNTTGVRKTLPIPPNSDPKKRRAMKAATAVASSGRSQMESSRAVAETPTQNSVADKSRMDVEGEERRIQKFESTEHQAKNCPEHIN